MSISILDQVSEIIKAAPHSSQALLLFGLIKTLDIEKGGQLYVLAKLKEMSEDTRELAYQLMEYMASGKTRDDAWKHFIDTIEELIRNA